MFGIFSDGIETATTTLSGVSFTRDNSGGGTPTIPQQTTSTSSVQATSTLEFLSGQAIPNLAGLTGQARQVVIQQIKSQIVEVQKKLIVLISQLIQLLQEQFNQLNAR